MPDSHPNIFGLLDLAVDRSDASTRQHLRRCESCSRRAHGVRALVAHGQRAHAAPRLESRHMRRAMKAFRAARATWFHETLRLVTDCLFGVPAPALRRASAPDEIRFLRFEGALTVEVQVRVATARATLHGSMLPPDAADEIVLEGCERTIRVMPDNTGGFVFRDVPRGEYQLCFGAVRSETLRL